MNPARFTLALFAGTLVLGGCTAPAFVPRVGDDSMPDPTIESAPARAQQPVEAHRPQLVEPQKVPDHVDAKNGDELHQILAHTSPAMQPLVIHGFLEKHSPQDPQPGPPYQPQTSGSVVVAPSKPAVRSPIMHDIHVRDEQTSSRTVAKQIAKTDEQSLFKGKAAASVASPSATAVKAGDWKRFAVETIHSLEAELRNDELDTDRRGKLEAYLRLLYVITDNRTAAVSPISPLPEAEREFWRQQLRGLSIYFNDSLPLADRRATLALKHLRTAVDHLAEVSSLEVRNAAFCKRVDSYGQYTEFTSPTFRSDQEVLLYVELDNFTAQRQESRDVYETALQGSYYIFDPNGRRMAQHTFPVEKEVCRNRRRDFFIPFRMYIPKVAPGRYQLQLTVEDLKGDKFGQSSMLEFTVTK